MSQNPNQPLAETPPDLTSQNLFHELGNEPPRPPEIPTNNENSDDLEEVQGVLASTNFRLIVAICVTILSALILWWILA